MAGPGSRMSMYSVQSNGPRTAMQPSQQVSTTTLLNALHTSYTSARPYCLESSTSLVVNTWVTALDAGPDGSTGGVVDAELAHRAWEHARRRAEDGCIVLGYVRGHGLFSRPLSVTLHPHPHHLQHLNRPDRSHCIHRLQPRPSTIC